MYVQSQVTVFNANAYLEVPLDQACTDGNLVTVQAWPAHPAWLAAFLKVLGTRIEP
jgi:protease I